MAAATHNLVIDQGSDFSFSFTLKKNGVLESLVGFSARAHFRRRKTDDLIAGQFTCTVDENTSSVLVYLKGSDSSAIEAGNYYYDLEIYTANEEVVRRLLQGSVTITPEITK